MALIIQHVPVLPELAGAHAAFAAWVGAWHHRKWEAMAAASQLTWANTPKPHQKWREELGRATPSSPAEILEDRYGLSDLEQVRVEKIERLGDCAVDITAVLHYTEWGSGQKRQRITARVICEVGIRKPSPDGQWGVNPVSALREEPA